MVLVLSSLHYISPFFLLSCGAHFSCDTGWNSVPSQIYECKIELQVSLHMDVRYVHIVQA
jgi:hypothetical protein